MLCQVRICPEDSQFAELKLEDSTIVTLHRTEHTFPGTSLNPLHSSFQADILNSAWLKAKWDLEAQLDAEFDSLTQNSMSGTM